MWIWLVEVALVFLINVSQVVKWCMKCFIYWTADWKSSKLWSSQLWREFKQLRIEAWKSQDFNGVRTRDLVIPVRRSNQLSYEATDVGSWSFVSFNEPVKSGFEVIYETFHISLHNVYSPHLNTIGWEPVKNPWKTCEISSDTCRNTLWKNLWILQGLNFVEKSQNLEPVKKPVNFKTCEKTYEKTYFTINVNVKKQRRFDRSTVIFKLKSKKNFFFLYALKYTIDYKNANEILIKTLKYLHRNNTSKKNILRHE